MKKLFYTFITVLTTFTVSQAQLVLDRSDMAGAGERFTMATDTLVTVGNSFYSKGSGKTWNFSNMTKDNRFVSRYYTASSTPGGSQFPSADLAYQEDSTDDFMYYMETSNSQIRIIGSNDTNDFSQVNFRAFVFPLQLNTAWTDTSKLTKTVPGADIGLPFDSVKFEITIVFKNVVDAEGSLSIPDFTGNALRVYRNIWNSVDVSAKQGSFPWFPVTSQEDSTMSYDFVGDNSRTWIARFDNIQDDDFEVMFKDLYPLSVKKLKTVEVRVFPNPAKDMVIVDLKAQKATYTVMGMNGAEVLSGQLNQGQNEVYFSGLARGMYMMNIVDNTGAVRAERIVIE